MKKLKNKVIGKRIQQARTELDFTQEELAENVGLTRAQIANIETGRTELSISVAGDICKFLGLRIEQLIQDDESELEALILFKREKCDSYADDDLIGWSDAILKELLAQKELCRKRGERVLL